MSPNHRLQNLGVSAWTPPIPQEDVWEMLERLAQEIGHCDDAVLQQRLALQAVRDCIEADVVYWHPGASRDAVQVVGVQDLPADWCCKFAARLLEKTPGIDGRLLRSVLRPGPRLAMIQPHSAALVRVSKSRSIWMVALSLTARRSFQAADLRIMSLIRQILVSQRRRCGLTCRMSETLSWMVKSLTAAIDAHVPHAQGHSERVAKIAAEIGKRMHLPTPVISDLYFAGLLHDIGISSVLQSVLLKPGPLTVEEFAHVQTAPVLGDGILAGIKQLAHLRPAVRHHHERYDGRGYPDGLAGDEIPLLGRILSVADAFDAMLSPRPYRPALDRQRVHIILAEGAGRRWDPVVVEHLLACRDFLHTVRATVTPSHASPALKYAVEAWNIDTSRNLAVSAPPVQPEPPRVGVMEGSLP
jgi:HD-GYP domain-containing protein (c-di-GMP phosphodiesterase class II)